MTINFPADVIPGFGVHASQHLAGGNDPIQLASASQPGLASAALAAVGIVASKGTLVPSAINLASSGEHTPYTQVGAVAFALAAVTEIPGAYITVQITGDGSAITWSADFAEIQGGDLTVGDYAGFTGSRRLVIVWSGAQGKALVALSSAGFDQADNLVGGFLQTVATHTHGSAGAVAPDLLTGAVGSLTITMNASGTSWAPTNVPSTTGKRYPVQVDFVQGAAGSLTLDLSAVDWGDAPAPSLPATAGSVLSVLFEYRGGDLRGFFQGVKTA